MLNFKVKVFSPKKRKTNEIVRVDNKIFKGVVFIDKDNNYKVRVNISNNNTPDILELSLTERSYEVQGKKAVFSKTKTKGKFTLYMRDGSKAKFMPGTKEQYIPFAPNWVISGYIVKEKLIKKFDFKTLIGVNGCITNSLNFEDEQ